MTALAARCVRDVAGWPQLHDLDVGATVSVPGRDGERRLQLLGLRHLLQPEHWVADNAARTSVRAAVARIAIDDDEHELVLRPYQMPTEIGGLRIALENTRLWAEETPQTHATPGLSAAARLAVLPAGQPWGPRAFRFPLPGWRASSSSYRNTWTSVVPYSGGIYYHRGEDYGALPDRLAVCAALDGIVSQSPLPAGDGRSNGLVIDAADGVQLRYAHMDIEEIDPRLVPGARVACGEIIGRSGCTWAGRRSQHADPHLHLGLVADGQALASHAYLAEAYLRQPGRTVLAEAGGQAWLRAGDTLELDGSRSVAAPGRRIAAMRWHLHDGRVVDGALIPLRYGRPGLYAEELRVTADDGSEDRSFLQVRVWDPDHGRDIARGWCYRSPAGDLRCGKELTVACRFTEVDDLRVDFGDGSPARPCAARGELVHRYERPSIHTIACTGRGPRGEPVCVKIAVAVD